MGSTESPPGTSSGSSIFQASRPRGCIGTVVSGGCGCLAFLVGAALAIAIAAPQLLAGWGARAVEQHVSGLVDGDVVIGELELHWNDRQRARNVRLRSGDQQLMSGDVRFPSLLDLLARPEKAWTINVSNLAVNARVDPNGSSDLGRALGLDPSGSTTELEALQEAVGGWLARSSGKNHSRSVSVHVALQSAEFRSRTGSFPDPAAEGAPAGPPEPVGTRFARVTGLHLNVDASRVGCGFEVTNAKVTGSDFLGEASVELSARFGDGADTELLLQSADLTAGAIPHSTLQLLGVMGRRRRPSRSVSGPESGTAGAAQAGIRALEACLGDGASVTFRYGVHSSGAGDRAAHPRVSLELESDSGKLSYRALHRDSQLVAVAERGDDNVLDARFELPHGWLTDLARTFVPPGIDIQEPFEKTVWSLQARELRWPLSTSSLELGALVSRMPENAETGSLQLFTHLARLAKTCDGRLYLASTANAPSTLELQPADPEERGDYDRIDATHALTTIDFAGDLGSHVTSNWRIGDGSAGQARLDVDVPGAVLGSGEAPEPRLDLSVPMVSKKMLRAIVPLPDEVFLLLTYRIQRLTLKGLQLARNQERPISVSLVPNGNDRIDGVYRQGGDSAQGGLFTVPKAQISMPLDEGACELVLRRFMPWFTEVEPLSPGEEDRVLLLLIEGLEFPLVTGEFLQEGRVEVRASPLRVRLQPDIAGRFLNSDPDDDGWIAWTPGPTVMLLEPSIVRYTQLEVPFNDAYVAPFKGHFDRLLGRCTLDGYVDSDMLTGNEGPSLPVGVSLVVENTAAGVSADVYRRMGAVKDEVKEMLDKALSTKTKPQKK